jgi:recombination protein RecR
VAQWPGAEGAVSGESDVGVYEASVETLIDELGRLPGVGPKSAQRIAYHLLKIAPEDANRLAAAITDAKAKVTWCRRCFNLAEGELCSFCRDERRDPKLLCVVEEPRDIAALERTHEFNGRYHVLQGAISPIEGIGPEQLRVKELVRRVDEEGVSEVILATNPNIEGEATAMYLAKLLKPSGIRVTRIASGLPVGGDLEYADEITLGRALEGRRDVDA